MWSRYWRPSGVRRRAWRLPFSGSIAEMLQLALRAAAAAKGVGVTAVIAFANRGGEQNLRKLELRFLDAGIVVARSANDLIRYHGKYILIDRRVLYVLSFNFTHLDIDHSRGFGIVTSNANWVRGSDTALRSGLHADHICTRQRGRDTFVVSPTNSRRLLGAFLRGAKAQAPDLRPQDLRYGAVCSEHTTRAGESGRRGQGHWLGDGPAPVSRCRNWVTGGCIRARLSATAIRRSSAVRAFGRRSWTRAVRWA